MAYSEQLAQRLRDALEGVRRVEEKKMFGGIAFMVNGKMYFTAGPQRMMVRIDPTLHDDAVSKSGCKTVVMKGRVYRGYVHVAERNVATDTALQYWVNLALDYNKKVKASASKVKKAAARPAKKTKKMSKSKK